MKPNRLYMICNSSIWIVVVTFLCLLGSAGTGAAASTDELKILAIHAYHQGYGWTEGQHEGFASTLKSKLPQTELQIYSEYLDTKRRSFDPAYRTFFLNYLRDKYQNFKPDLIYTTDDNGLTFVLEEAREVFTTVPIVFSGVNNLNQERHLTPSMQGIFERLQVQQNLDLLRKLHPDLNEILVVGDGSSTHRAMAEAIRREGWEHGSWLEMEFLADRSLTQVVSQLRKRKQGVVLLSTIGGFWDDQNQVAPLPQVVKAIAGAGDFQIFVMEDTYLLPGAIGGWVNSSRFQGNSAAKVAVSMLTSDSPLQPQQAVTAAEAVFDYQALRKHQLPRVLLPEGSRLINEPINLISQYPYESFAVACVLFSLLWIIALLSLNINRRRRAEKELQASRWQMQRLFEDAPDAIYLVSLDGQILDVNEHAEESLGVEREQLRKMSVFDIDPIFTPDMLDGLLREIEVEDNRHFESKHRQANGTVFPVDIRVSRCEWADQPVLLCYVRDISDRKQHELQLLENEERLNYLAFHDSLTGLPNRLLFQDRLEHAINLAARHETGVAVFFLDLDRFKNINDSLGHDIGDRVLCRVAERLKKTVRSTDTVGRLGGDEFVILVEDVTDVDSLTHLAQKVKETVQPAISLPEGELFVTTSIGLALYPEDSASAQGLMKYADVAMYKAKETRNCYRFYHAEMNARATEFLFLESSLRRALEQDQFVLHYQPQFELEDGQLVGMEALLRWHHPERGMVPPGDFIPLAEETGLILPMGDWILREACYQIRTWQETGLPVVPVAVNISPAQFQQSDWSQTVANILEETGIEPYLLELEITENLLMEHSEAAMSTMSDLKEMGVAVSIDDFGAGYSSLAYLSRFPLKKLKIDRSFITDFETSFNDAAIVCTVINLGWNLGLQIVAEGIENEKQLQFLVEQGCHQGQGFLLGRPTPAEDMSVLLKKHR